MPDAGGPWRRESETPAQPKTPRGGRLAWLAVVAMLVAGAMLLFRAFPGALQSPGDWAWLVGGGAWVALVSAGILRAGPIQWAEKARHIAIWAGIVGILAVGLTFRDELAAIGQRVRGEFSSSYPVASGPRELVVTQDENGGFFVMGRVNDQPVRFLVDTGASDTVLSPEDAKRVGIDIGSLHFDQQAETANGLGYGAGATVDSLQVGAIRFDKMPVTVNQAPLRNSLLGMSFLTRLESFHFTGRKLYLKARD